MDDIVIQVDGLSKIYKLGQINRGTLRAELQSWMAKKQGKADPNLKIGAKQYAANEEFSALHNVQFQVRRSDRIGIIGSNGAGKSTLLKILSRVTAPTEGTIRMRGRVSSMLEVGTGFNKELTGRENIYLNGAILGMSKAEVSKKLGDIIAFSQCEQFIDTPVKRYSSGMYVKLAFAVAAHLDSEILMMDEVLAVGDMRFQEKCLDKMDAISKAEGKTILYVSHNIHTIRQLCNRCLVLDQGKLIYDGDCEGAISLYLDKKIHHEVSDINLRAMRRPNNFDPSLNMVKLVLEDTEDGIYDEVRCIKALLEWETLRTSSNIRMRIMVKFQEQNVGGAVSEILCEQSLAGDRAQSRFSLDISMLSPGDYSLNLALFTTNSYGTQRLYDHVYQAVHFTVKDDSISKQLLWRNHVWGNVIFPDITIH